ncbi:cobyrinate a,c-diamide synthase [Trichothermofontia sp.]
MSLVIAGERSGVGKTTLTLALLAALRRQGVTVQSFKVGPDYIDPMFHQAATGRPCRNLDPVLTSPSYVQWCFQTHTQGVAYALIEGVMGLFDGVEVPDGVQPSTVNCPPSTVNPHRIPELPPSTSTFASTAHVAQLLDLPVLLVLDCRHLSGSIAAIVHGYQHFDPQIRIAGVVLNRVGSDRHRQLLTQALAHLQARQGNAPPVLGVIHRQADLTLPDRHLGLVPTAELNDLPQFLDRLADLAEQCFDWEVLLPLFRVESDPGGERKPSNANPALAPVYFNPACHTGGVRAGHVSANRSLEQPASTPADSPVAYPSVRSVAIAVAYDRAFSFYYADNLDLLRQWGADLCFWSPLQDATLPAGIQGLYFGGGFPEMFARELTENRAVRWAVKAAIEAGMPTYAECGGLMYLSEQLIDFEQKSWAMVGVLPCTVQMGDRLILGYRRAEALYDTAFMAAGTQVWGHEFHRSRIVETNTEIKTTNRGPGNDAIGPVAQPSPPATPLWHLYSLSTPTIAQSEGWHCHHLHTSYLHLHWGTHPHLAHQFVQQCAHYSNA